MDSSLNTLLRFSLLGSLFLLLGLSRLLLSRTSWAWRLAIPLSIVCGICTGYSLISEDLLGAVLVFACVSTFTLILDGLSSSILLPVVQSFLKLFQSQTVVWSAVLFGGVLLILGAVIHHDYAFAMQTHEDMEYLMMESSGIEFADHPHLQARTDQGNQLELRTLKEQALVETNVDFEKNYLERSKFNNNLIRRGKADGQSNCHGWVFTDGQFWVPGSAVPRILQENNYHLTSNPLPGDIAIYRDDAGNVTHTALVRYVTPGQPTLVESKWGALGIYLHNISECPYGKQFEFYHSSRQGHVLKEMPLHP
jgi:hypothetical protein